VQTRRWPGDDDEMQRFVPIEGLFKGRHFDRQIIVGCVSWYTSFKLSLRDLVWSEKWICLKQRWFVTAVLKTRDNELT
jgi:hypothetical protein